MLYRFSRCYWMPLSMVIGIVFSSSTFANDDELAKLKAQIIEQQAQLEQMKQTLLALEKKTAEINAIHRPPESTVKATELTGNPFSGKKMNPDISVIADGGFVNRSYHTNGNTLTLPAFNSSIQGEDTPNTQNGFNFNYAELVFSASVDHYFDLFTVVHAGEAGAEIEEAYANTRNLPFNTQLKFGKFLSGFGRLNGQHHHAWDFADQPLIYQGIFGSHGLLEKGIQATWLAPTDTYLLFGIEALQGENEQSFGTSAISGTHKGAIDGAGVAVAFAKTSVDVGNSSWLAGVSYAAGQLRSDHTDNINTPYAKGGDSAIYGVDLTGKYFLDATRYVMWQSEYIKRDISNGILANYDPNNLSLITSQQLLSQAQSGYYSQLIWKFNPQWRIGYRYDAIDHNNMNEVQYLHGDRDSLMLEYNPTEFSRIRLQYAQNAAYAPEGATRLERFNEIVLQFNMSIGAHGAHSF